MKKKILFFVMALFVACLLTVCVSAVEVDGIYYSFTPNPDAYPGYDGTATVNTDNRKLGTLTNIVIPEIVEYDSDSDGVADKRYVVTEIESGAIGANGGSNSPVVSIVVPRTVKKIGEHAFRQLKYLETVTIKARGYNPSTGEDYTTELSFSNAEFYSSGALQKIDMSESNVTSLDKYCFHHCTSLHTVLFSKNIKSIGSSFSNNGKLTTISSIETLEHLNGGFYGTKISGDIKLNNLKSFSGQAFRGTNITSVDLSGTNLSTIPSYAFAECYSLVTVKLPDCISKIESYAFQNSSAITSINITDNLTTVGGMAFKDCTSLVGVVLPNTLTYLGDKAFYGANVSGDLVLKNVTYFGESALRKTNITSIDLSACDITEIASYALAENSRLTTVVLPDTVTAFRSGAFKSSPVTSLNLNSGVTIIESSAFWGPKFGGDLVFDNLETFGAHALRETNITSLVIKGNSLTSLSTDASLYGCTKLEILVLPETVTTAGANTFTNCNSLKYIVASENFTVIGSRPPKADIIIAGNNTDGVASAFGGWSVAPFSEFDPDKAGTKTIYYGAEKVNGTVATYATFEAFDKGFSSWDATTNEKNSYSAIFTAQGYSTSPDKTSIATGFNVNQTSLAAYKELFGGEINFGIVIFNPKYLGEDSFFNEDGTFNTNGGTLLVDVGTEYSTCSLSVHGFSASNSGLELVFAGYAYADGSEIELFQKDYTGTTENPVSSPMVSKVTRNDATLYTTTIASVTNHSMISTGKEELKEYFL